MEKNSKFESVIKYDGFKGVALDGTTLKYGHNLEHVIANAYNNDGYSSLLSTVNNLESMPLKDVKASAKNFFHNHLNLHTVSTVDGKTIKDNISDISRSRTGNAAYDKVNSLLKETDPLKVPVRVIEGHPMVSLLRKPIIRIPNYLEADNRKVYFEDIEIGKTLNELSVGTLVNEIASTQQESNLGYAEDYLNKKIISYFLEKVALKELCEQDRSFRLAEMLRFSILISKYHKIKMCYNDDKDPDINDLLYVKSLLYATKLFDDYCNERNESVRDKYFDDVQDVFDGKITVEDVLNKRDITMDKCMSKSVIGRHM